MNVLIRVDASLLIGSGHVMRCLTLAKVLRESGAEVTFICREHDGHMKAKINGQGFTCLLLSVEKLTSSKLIALKNQDEKNSYLAWLGCTVLKDAKQVLNRLRDLNIEHEFDWVICDHYALDITWQNAIRDIAKKIFVIDDLANRNHECDLVLDQTFLCDEHKYKERVNASCEQLLGTDYALLGNEYSKLRTTEMLNARLNKKSIIDILVFMGGADSLNWTAKVLKVINTLSQNKEADKSINEEVKIKIVIGSQYQFLTSLEKEIQNTKLPIELLVDTNNMAQLIANSDIAIGAGGGSSWERCSLGLPTLTCVVAENQEELANKLESSKATLLWETEQQLEERLIMLFNNPSLLHGLSRQSASICDGKGAQRVKDKMFKMVSIE